MATKKLNIDNKKIGGLIMVFKLALMLLISTIVGLAFFIMGIKVITKKTLIVSSKVLLALIVLAFLPMAINEISRIAVFQFTSAGIISMIFLAIIIVVLLFIKKSFGTITIFNITNDVLYESIFAVFSEENITCEEKYSQILLKEIDASVKVSINTKINTATLTFINQEKIPNYEKILNNLKNKLKDNKFKGRPYLGIVYILIGSLLTLFNIIIFALLISLN